METEEEYLLTCVNLKNQPQMGEYRTADGIEMVELKPYEVRLIRRPRR
jgi:hypothetical protein